MIQAHNPQPQSNSFSLWRHQSCDERLEKLGTVLPTLVKTVEQRQDLLECANEALRSDVQRWHQEKQQALKNILIQFANQQIQFYEQSVAAWERVVNDCSSQDIIVPSN